VDLLISNELIEREREIQEESFGARRPQKTQENEERPQYSSNKKPNQNQASNTSGMAFGREDNKTPQDLKEVKDFEKELMNLQMQRDNVNYFVVLYF